MNESFIIRSIKKFKKSIIIQCIPQEVKRNCLSKNKPMYPDIIAFKNETMIIGESKPKYMNQSPKIK